MTYIRRFHIFAGSTYYPYSGLGDYVTSVETEAEARKLIAHDLSRGNDWWVIIKTEDDGSLVTVESGGSMYE